MFGQYPYRFGCEGGVCQFLGCESDDECTFDGALMGYICVQLDGYGACYASCAQDQDCEDQFLSGWICGPASYCVPPPCYDDSDCTAGTVCDIDLGQCVGGCTSDEQCAGYGVCDPSSHTCVCTSSDECADGFTCAPL
jgi:Cys-rich repeat protein